MIKEWINNVFSSHHFIWREFNSMTNCPRGSPFEFDLKKIFLSVYLKKCLNKH